MHRFTHASAKKQLLNLVLFALPCMFFAVAHAAPAAKKKAEPKSPLSPAAVHVLDTLNTVGKFPAQPWRTHAGDLPHGEDPALDDAAWKPVSKPQIVPSMSATWYRQWFTVPARIAGYDITGTKILFEFRAHTRGDLQEIIYLNGRRVALGEQIEPITLTASAHPGERILIAVKLLPTGREKTVQPARFTLLFDPARPDPQAFRTELLTLQTLLPQISAKNPETLSILNRAATAVDLEALQAGDQKKFDASLLKAESTLAPLRPIAQQYTFYLTGNSHIDAAWLWPWTETVDVVKRTFQTALQLMDEYPDYTFTQSAAQYNVWMANKYPGIDDEIKRRVKEGRWELVGGMWVEPDLNLPGGESIVRSILLGKRFYQQHYGVDVHVGWNPDSFGYNWQLPQIYKKSGIDYFVTQKMTWNDTNQLPLKLFWWESPDGSKVLTYFPHGYGNTAMDPLRLATDFAAASTKNPGTTEMLDLYGISDHGGGPTRVILDQIERWRADKRAVPKYQYGTAGNFFHTVEKQIAPESRTWDYQNIAGFTPAPPVQGSMSIPTWNDELYLEYHRGVYTTQATHKRNMREKERELLDAEKFASLGWLYGDTYPAADFENAWQKVTFNDFHDLAAGSGIADIYRDAEADYAEVHRIAQKATAAAMHTLDARAGSDAQKGVPVIVWNTLGWQRAGEVQFTVQMPQPAKSVTVTDAEGHALVAQKQHIDAATNTFTIQVQVPSVPSLGFTTLYARDGGDAASSDLKKPFLTPETITLQNAHLRVVIRRSDGCITSLVSSGTEAIAPNGCGNELQAFKDNPAKYDAWNIDPGTLDVPPMILQAVNSLDVTEDDALRTTVTIHRKWQHSTFTQQISLDADAYEAVVDTTVDWREQHILLKAAFPLAHTAPNATFEIPYGTIERPTTRNTSWEKARFEVPAINWADLGDAGFGVSLINDSKYGYDAVGNLLRLTVLRSPTSPDPNADQGEQHFRYAILPHAGNWKQARTMHAGYEFNTPMEALQIDRHAGSLGASHSFLSGLPEGVVLSAVKKAEDDDALIFRVYEWQGAGEALSMQLPAELDAPKVVNLMEKADGATASANLAIKPYEILTVEANKTKQQ